MSRILFASMPFDGHFNPLTGLAAHLRAQGHDVRFYTGPLYAKKLAQAGIPHLPFVHATDVNALNIEEYLPEYSKMGHGPKAIEYAAKTIFFGNIANHVRDVTDIKAQFDFDALVCDGAFYAASIIAAKLQPRVYPVWVAQTPAPTGRNVPPPFFGLRPARSVFGRLRDRVIGALMNRINERCRPILNEARQREGLAPYLGSIWDIHNDTARAMFQVGVPGFDYPRDDWPAQHVFVGALQPWAPPAAERRLPPEVAERIERAQSVVVVSQGTVDNRDPEKLMVPTIEALRGGRHLVVATTGGRHRDALRSRYGDDRTVLVEDYLDYHALMPQADLFVSNGGYGSVLFALAHGVPVVGAGKLEGKCDINARLDYCGLGVDLRSERPTAKRIRAAVERVLGDGAVQVAVERLQRELAACDSFAIIEERLARDGIIRPARAQP